MLVALAGEVREVGRWGRDCIDSYTIVTPPNPLWSLQTDHHPEWFNVYNRVEVTLATHTCNGVSDKVRGRGGVWEGLGAHPWEARATCTPNRSA